MTFSALLRTISEMCVGVAVGVGMNVELVVAVDMVVGVVMGVNVGVGVTWCVAMTVIVDAYVDSSVAEVGDNSIAILVGSATTISVNERIQNKVSDCDHKTHVRLCCLNISCVYKAHVRPSLN